jgi:hypothetical protein
MDFGSWKRFLEMEKLLLGNGSVTWAESAHSVRVGSWPRALRRGLTGSRRRPVGKPHQPVPLRHGLEIKNRAAPSARSTNGGTQVNASEVAAATLGRVLGVRGNGPGDD